MPCPRLHDQITPTALMLAGGFLLWWCLALPPAPDAPRPASDATATVRTPPRLMPTSTTGPTSTATASRSSLAPPGRDSGTNQKVAVHANRKGSLFPRSTAPAETTAGQSPVHNPRSPQPPAIFRPEFSVPSSPIAFDPALPGAFLTVNGQLVQVEAFQSIPTASAPALHIAVTPKITPISGKTGDFASGTAPATAGMASNPDLSSGITPELISTDYIGFTLEEEEFRTKWGWAAYDAVRRATLTPDPSAE